MRVVTDTFDSAVNWHAICVDLAGNPLSLHHRYTPKNDLPAAP
jgi:hypothetical protein